MADNNATLMVVLLIIGAAILGGFFMWIRARERVPARRRCSPPCSSAIARRTLGSSFRTCNG